VKGWDNVLSEKAGRIGLQAKLCVGAEPDQLERQLVRKPIDEHHVRLEATISTVAPVTRQRMVASFWFKRNFVRQFLYHGQQTALQRFTAAPLGFPTIVSLEF